MTRGPFILAAVFVLTISSWARPNDRLAFLFPIEGVRRAPAELGIQLRVRPHADNRGIVVVYESCCGESGSTLIDLPDGEDGPRVVPLEPRRVYLGTPGTYRFVASLIVSSGKVAARASVRVVVIG